MSRATKNITGRTFPTVADEAARWAARLLSGEMSGAELQQRDQWLAADPRHKQTSIEYSDIIAMADQAWVVVAEKILERDLERSASNLTGFNER